MDNKSKGIAWVSNIYQKFEAMCLEADDMVCQETLKYVENQLQTVGANVKQFCTELMQEVLPSSPPDSVEELCSILVNNAGVTVYEDSNISVDEDHSQKELINSSSVKTFEGVHFGLSSEKSIEDESALAHCSGSIPFDSVMLVKACKNEFQDIDSTLDDTSVDLKELMQEVLPSSPPDSVEELSSTLVNTAGVIVYEDSNISVDEDHSQKELINSSSVKTFDGVHFGLSSEKSIEDESALAHCSGSIPFDSVMLVKACKNEFQDIDSTLDDTSVDLKEEASHKPVSEMELEAVSAPPFDKVKLEESCIIVYSTELHSLSNGAGERRSFKKKFREAFSSKSRLAKRISDRHAELIEEKGTGVGLSSRSSKSESQDMEFRELDWEII